MELRNDGTYRRLKIPMSRVISVADEVVHHEAKKGKKNDLRKKCVKIVGENLSTMGKTENERTTMNIASEYIIGKEARKSEQRHPVSYCSLAQYYREQYPWIKKPRKQDNQTISGNKPSTVKRRPMSVSTQNIRYIDKDVSLAILSSQHIVKQVQKTMEWTKPCKSEVKKTKLNNFLQQGIPRFSHIDNEFQELCKSKPVERMTSARETTRMKEPNRSRRSFDNNNCRENNSHGKLSMHSKLETKSWNDFHRNTAGTNNHPVRGFQRSSPSSHSCVEKIQVSKNIYIRESDREIIENLVEVRDQDDLDILNTVKTLHSLKAKPVKLFENLRDSDVYHYPIHPK